MRIGHCSLFLVVLACGSPRKSPRDSGIILPPKLPADASISVSDPELPLGSGHVEVRARWLWPDSKLRRSPGRNSCGASRDAALEVELMGGLSNTAVFADVGTAPSAASMSISQCRIQPRVVVLGVSGKFSIENLDQRPHLVVIEELRGDGTLVKEVGRLPMRIAGQRFQVRPGDAEFLRIHAVEDPDDFAYVVISRGSAAVTDHRGNAELEIPSGKRSIRLWHPPTRGTFDDTAATRSVDIIPQHRSKHVVDVGLSSQSTKPKQ